VICTPKPHLPYPSIRATVFCMFLVSVTQASSIPADLNGDGVVDQQDVQRVQSSLGARDPNIIPVDSVSGPFVLDQGGKTYVLQGPTASPIVVHANDLILDLNGHQVRSMGMGGPGVSIQGREQITVRNGTIAGWARGIAIRDSNDLRVQDLAIQDCRQEGLAVDSSSRLCLEGVTCTGNMHGMAFSGVRAIRATDCRANENRDIGVQYTGCEDGLFSRMVARSNGTDGVDIEACHDLHIQGLQALENKDDGIDIRETTFASLSDSTSDNGGPSLELEGGSDVTVRDCQYADGSPSESLIGFNVVRRCSSLRVRVVDDNEDPVYGARVEIFDTRQAVAGQSGQADLVCALNTDFQGCLPALDLLWYTRVGILRTQSGPYRVRVSHRGFQDVEWVYDAHAPAQQTFALAPWPAG